MTELMLVNSKPKKVPGYIVLPSDSMIMLFNSLVNVVDVNFSTYSIYQYLVIYFLNHISSIPPYLLVRQF